KGHVVARHPRCRTAGEQVLDPPHFLATLQRKPAYLDHTRLFKELKLPAAFALLRQRLEKELGARSGMRHYIRVLQLLGRHSALQGAGAIEACTHRQGRRAEFIEQKLTTAQKMTADTDGGELSPSRPALCATIHRSSVEGLKLPGVTVPLPDLRRFDQL